MKKLTSKDGFMAKVSAMALGFLILIATPSWAQDQKVTINARGTTVQSVMSQIESQTGLTFFYENTKLNTTRRVSLNVKDESVSSVLSKLFNGTDVSFSFRDRNILLANKPATAQASKEKVYSGRVRDVNGDPIVGAYVVKPGTTQGTFTNNNGYFSIEDVNPGETLEISCIGFTSQNIRLGNRSDLNIVLLEDTQSLDASVAIGYGTVKKRDLTGAVASIASDDITRVTPTQTMDAMKGNIAGVNIMTNNGKAGSSFTMTIRGQSSIDQSNEPLVVVDGAIGADLNLLNPNDIEKIDILKDASSCAIYGSRGANGVIIVTTKRGLKGSRARVSYSGNIGLTHPVNLLEFEDPQTMVAHLDLWRQATGAAYPLSDAEKENIANERYFDWIDAVLKNGLQTEHTVSLSGGTNNMNYYFSVGYNKTVGNVSPEGYNRFNIKAGIDANLSETLSAGFTSTATYAIVNSGSPEILRSASRLRWTQWPYDDEGNLTMSPSGDAGMGNPLIEMKDDNYVEEDRTQGFMGNAYLEWRPIKGLSARSSISAMWNNYRSGFYVGLLTKSAAQNPAAVFSTYTPTQNMSYTWDNLITYNLEKGDHKLNINAGHTIAHERYEGMSLRVSNYSDNTQWYAMESAAAVDSRNSDYYDWSLVSFLGRVNYTWKDRYLITLTGRWDGSSKLAAGHKWKFFPSAAIAWRASEEEFIKNLNVFSNLKFRLSYGEVGNDSVRPYGTSSLVSAYTYNFGTATKAYAPASLSNSALGWEVSKEWNLGIELGLFKDRISINADLYNRKTDGLILGRALPPDTGYETITGNFAKTQNKGIELTINTINVSTKDFSWKTSINFSKNHNEILSLDAGGDLDIMYGNEITPAHQMGIGNTNYAKAFIVGEDISAVYWYEFDGIFQDGEQSSELAQSMYGIAAQAGFPKVKDQDGDGKITVADKKVLGTGSPSWTGGITNTFLYKNFDFSFSLYTFQDVYIFDEIYSTFAMPTMVIYKRMANVSYWSADNPSNEIGSVWSGLLSGGYGSTMYFHNTSWTRLQNVTLGYTLPMDFTQKMGISRLRVYLTANNPYMWSAWKHKTWDPEWGTYSSAGVGVSNASYLFGVNITF